MCLRYADELQNVSWPPTDSGLTLSSHIQTLSESQFERVASFASMSDLLTRLAEFPSEIKDWTSLATKLVLPVLKLLKEDSSNFDLEEAVCLLCKLINIFPSSVS